MTILLNRKRLVAVIVTMSVALLSCTRQSDSLEVSLYVAVCDGDLSETKRLLRLGANVDAIDVEGNSALMVAESCTTGPGRAELVELLIANGAAVNHRSGDGRTALMYAAKNGDAQAVKALLKSGASVNIADKEGETPLMKAVFFACDEETVKALLSAGADLHAKDHKGRNAFSNACLTGKLDLGEITGADKPR